MRESPIIIAIALGAVWAWAAAKPWLALYLAAIAMLELIVGLR